MGKPKKINSAEELGALIDAFIAAIESGEIDFPSDYRLCEYLGIAPQTLYDYMSNKDGRYNGYSERLKKMVIFREHYFSELGRDNPKLAGYTAFALKQPKNGGYADRPQGGNEPQKLIIQVKGADEPFE